MKNGGPERLPKIPKSGDVNMDGAGGKGKDEKNSKNGGGKGAGNKGAGKNMPPTNDAWQTYNPSGFFRKPQWAQWYPGSAPQLSVATEGGDWMATPGAMLGLRCIAPKPQPVTCSNKFEVLQGKDEELNGDYEPPTEPFEKRMTQQSKMPKKKRLCKPREAQCPKEGVRQIRGDPLKPPFAGCRPSICSPLREPRGGRCPGAAACRRGRGAGCGLEGLGPGVRGC